MAKFCEIDEQLWQDWVSSSPIEFRDMAKKFRPDTLYKMKSTGYRVYPVSFSEEGTLTVAVTGEFNSVLFDRKVFGISPDDLEECDLPPEGEQLGTALIKPDDVEAYLDSIRYSVVGDI